jgi:hypothetical protein
MCRGKAEVWKNHDVEKQRYWRRTIGDAARSGMSIREFCRQRRVKESQFYWWQRKLKAGRQERNKPSVQDRAASFALVSEDGMGMPAGLELVLQDGRRLRHARLPFRASRPRPRHIPPKSQGWCGSFCTGWDKSSARGGNLVQFFLAQRKQPALKLRFNHSLASTVVRNDFQYTERAATGRPEESAVSVPGQLVFARLGNATRPSTAGPPPVSVCPKNQPTAAAHPHPASCHRA